MLLLLGGAAPGARVVTAPRAWRGAAERRLPLFRPALRSAAADAVLDFTPWWERAAEEEEECPGDAAPAEPEQEIAAMVTEQ